MIIAIPTNKSEAARTVKKVTADINNISFSRSIIKLIRKTGVTHITFSCAVVKIKDLLAIRTSGLDASFV